MMTVLAGVVLPVEVPEPAPTSPDGFHVFPGFHIAPLLAEHRFAYFHVITRVAVRSSAWIGSHRPAG